MELINSIDITIFHLINDNGFLEMDKAMLVVSDKFTWIPLYLLLLYLLYKKYKANLLWITISLIILVFLADYGSVHFFKNTFERLRPCHQLEQVRIVGECGGLYSFISSHAANTFAIAFFIGLTLRNIKWFVFLFSWAVIIGYSRIYLGVHFPFDIIGGMFWALFVSLLVYNVFKSKLNEPI